MNDDDSTPRPMLGRRQHTRDDKFQNTTEKHPHALREKSLKTYNSTGTIQEGGSHESLFTSKSSWVAELNLGL